MIRYLLVLASFFILAFYVDFIVLTLNIKHGLVVFPLAFILTAVTFGLLNLGLERLKEYFQLKMEESMKELTKDSKYKENEHFIDLKKRIYKVLKVSIKKGKIFYKIQDVLSKREFEAYEEHDDIQLSTRVNNKVVEVLYKGKNKEKLKKV